MNPEEAKLKKEVGERWAARSDGQCNFLMVGKDDYQQRLQAVAG